MKLNQFKAFCEVIDAGLNVGRAANKLHMVASGVSKQLKLLEQELSVPLLERKGTRIVRLTKAGTSVLPVIRRILKDVERVRQIPRDIQLGSDGQLTIATTNINARDILVSVMQQFKKTYPSVELQLRQGTPIQIANWLLSGEVDLGIGTVPAAAAASMIRLPCYEHDHSVIVPRGHPLLRERHITLEQIAKYPLIANYADSRLGRLLEEPFIAKGIDFRVMIRATDPSVIKKYVAVGFGIAVLPTVALDPKEDSALRAIPAAHLFRSSTVSVIRRREAELPAYGNAFIEMVMELGRRMPVSSRLRRSRKV